MNKLKLLTCRKIMMLVETLNTYMPFAKDPNLSGLQVCQVAAAKTEYKKCTGKIYIGCPFIAISL